MLQRTLQSPNATHWLHVMTKEIGILKDNKVWELVHLPNNRKTIKCKWSSQQKHLPNGNVHKFKARDDHVGCKAKGPNEK